LSHFSNILRKDRDRALYLYHQMVLIREFEQKVEQLFMQGKIHGTMHLCVGQEATAVGACSVLRDEDKITTTHRGHGQCIAKGADINRMMAEILGKATGLCKGKGGSMHLADLDKGNLGANGIVAGGLPIATGAALTSKMKKLGYVVVSFFGDGATNQGSFHESLNLAAIWDLPVVFFCENNQYAMSAPVYEMIKVPDIAERASAYGIPGVVVDGSDLLEVMRVTSEAVERARRGEGPTLIEAKTYRFKGHSRSDARKYRTREEEREWMEKRDPIKKYRSWLAGEGLASEQELDQYDADARKDVEAAAEFAENSPEPSLDLLTEDVYA